MAIVLFDVLFVASVYLVRIFTLYLHNSYNIISLSLKLIKPAAFFIMYDRMVVGFTTS
jgi:hypothetical protein